MRHGGSPKPGSRKRELDVRAEKGTDEVQNCEAGSVNWTLEQSETRKKSKTGKLGTWIGRKSRVRHG